MNEPDQWSESDLQRYCDDGVGESLRLEFKACGAWSKNPDAKKEIGKDVSAMANAAGGVIIYGIKEKDRVADSIDAGFDPSTYTKEALEQIIDSNIQPRIEGLKISIIRLQSRGNNVAYAVEVPQATSRAPHQAADYRYYKRANFLNQVMEDYEIRDAMNRAAPPELTLQFDGWNSGGSYGNTANATSVVHLEFSLMNHGRVSACAPYVRIEKVVGGKIERIVTAAYDVSTLHEHTYTNKRVYAGDGNIYVHPGLAVPAFRFTYSIFSDGRSPSQVNGVPIHEAMLSFDYVFGCQNGRMRNGSFSLGGADLEHFLTAPLNVLLKKHQPLNQPTILSAHA